MASTSDNNILQLDVGGVQYKTSRSTLTKYGDSMLAAMFRQPGSGEGSEIPPAAVTQDGSYFIDRNGDMFHYVLSFLRNDTLICPTDWGVNEYKELMVEADYYQIGAMVQHINTNIQRLEDDRRVKRKETKYNEDELLILRYYNRSMWMFGTHETLEKLVDEQDMPTGEESNSKYLGICISCRDYDKVYDISRKVLNLGFFKIMRPESDSGIAKYRKVTDAVAKMIMNREETEESVVQMQRMFDL